MSNRVGSALATAALVALVQLPVAEATVMVPVPLETLVEEAVGIVHARVVDSGVQMLIHPNGDSLDPHTVTTLEVREWIKGNGPRRITLREFGGQHRFGGAQIDGTPNYAIGEEVIVFLAESASPRHFRTLQMVQGKFSILLAVPGVEPLVTRDTTGVALLSSGNFGLTTLRHGEREAIPLSEFRQRIDAALRPRSTGQSPGGTPRAETSE